MKDSRQQWKNMAVFVRSLERRVPVDQVAKEVRTNGKLDYKPEMFSIAEDHLILRFKIEKDCSLMLTGEPWFVASQLLAIEHWEPDFVPSQRLIQKTVVQMRLPGLLVEYWLSQMIMAIAVEAGKPLAMTSRTS